MGVLDGAPLFEPPGCRGDVIAGTDPSGRVFLASVCTPGFYATTTCDGSDAGVVFETPLELLQSVGPVRRVRIRGGTGKPTPLAFATEDDDDTAPKKSRKKPRASVSSERVDTTTSKSHRVDELAVPVPRACTPPNDWALGAIDAFHGLLEEADIEALVNDGGAAGLLAQHLADDEAGAQPRAAAATQSTADDETELEEDMEWLPKEGRYTPVPPTDLTHIIFVAGSKTHAALVVYARADPPQQWARVADVGGALADTGHFHGGHTSLLAAHLWVKTHLSEEKKVAIASGDLTILDQVTRNAATSGAAVFTVSATIALRDAGARHHLTLFNGDNPAAGTLASAHAAGEIGSFKALLASLPPPAAGKPRTKINRIKGSKSLFVPRKRKHAAPLALFTEDQASKPLEAKEFLEHVPTFWKVLPRDVALLARRVAEIVGDFPAADADKQLRIWRLFLRFPRKVLPQVGVLGGKLASMRKRLRGETPDETEAEDAGGTPKQPAERAINAATALAHEGLLAKGMRALMRKNDPLPEDIAERARKLHPEGEDLNLPAPFDSDWIAVDDSLVHKVLRESATLKAPGPTGWTEDLLLQCAKEARCKAAFAAMARDILAGDVPAEIREVITSSRFVAIYDKERDKLRPVAVGEAIVKIFEGIAMRHPKTKEFCKALSTEGIQYAFKEAGCELIIHNVRKELENGDCLVALDGRNAFNSIHRRGIFRVVNERLPQLAQLTHVLYAQKSQLLNELTPDLVSAEGVRQGSVTGPLLFCAAIHDVLRASAEAQPTVKVRAFMDDICATGPRDAVAEWARFVVPRLAAVGIETNLAKSVVIGDAGIAQQLQIPLATAGTRLLGAMVGGTKAESEAFVDKIVDDSAVMFSRLRQMKPEIGIPLLTKCAVPKMSYATRVHEPGVTRKACEKFDDEIIRSVSQFAGIKVLCDEQKTIAHLPIRKGGLGATMQTRIAHRAYETSVSLLSETPKIQRTLVDADNTDLVAALPKTWRDHLKRVAAGSSAWLLSCRPNQTYGYALKIRLLAACGSLKVCPACGATLDDASAHVLSCTKLEGWNAASRHNAIRDTVHHFCGSHGIFSSREPFVGENTSGTRARADLRITLSTGDTYIDFTVSKRLLGSSDASRKQRRRTTKGPTSRMTS